MIGSSPERSSSGPYNGVEGITRTNVEGVTTIPKENFRPRSTGREGMECLKDRGHPPPESSRSETSKTDNGKSGTKRSRPS